MFTIATLKTQQRSTTEHYYTPSLKCAWIRIDSTQDTCEDPKQYPHKSWRPWFCQCHKHCKSKRRPTPYYLSCRHVQFGWTIMSPWIQRGQNGHNFTWKRTDRYCSHISHTHTHTQPKFLICSAIFRRTSTCLKTKRPNLLFLHQKFIKHHLVTLPAGPSSIHVYPNLYIIWRVVGRCKLDFQTSRSKSLYQTMVYTNIRYVSL